MTPTPRITAAIPTPIWSDLPRRRRTAGPVPTAWSTLGSGAWASVNGTRCPPAGWFSSLGRGHDLGALAGEDGGQEAEADQASPEDAIGDRRPDKFADHGAGGGAGDQGKLGDGEAAAHDGATVGSVAQVHQGGDVRDRVDGVAGAREQQKDRDQPERAH